MALSHYYDEKGKFLASRGEGTPVRRRVIFRDEFQKIVERDAWLRKIKRDLGLAVFDNIKLFGDSAEKPLSAASQQLTVQQNGASVIAALVQAAQRTGKEQGAYITFRGSTGDLGYLVAQPTSSSATDFVFPIGTSDTRVVVPSNPTLQVIGTVHTHYADVAAMNRVTPGVRHSIAPQVSDLDRNSAKTNGIVVYAVDAANVHKALPNGQPQNKLPRNLDILKDAFDTFSRA
ncbi:MAG: hypothetical protein ABW194_01015 [Novosphingobium sp.]